MTVTVASLRQNFPELASTTMFPDSMISFWLGWASKLLDPERWDEDLDLGTELWTAHHCALEAKAEQQAAAGGIPGLMFGLISSKSVGPLSIGYDNTLGILRDENAGDFNLTTYGVRFYRLLKMFGSGGYQIS